MFETVIRILGGLLSAFELSKEKIFLSKAQACDARPAHRHCEQHHLHLHYLHPHLTSSTALLCRSSPTS